MSVFVMLILMGSSNEFKYIDVDIYDDKGKCEVAAKRMSNRLGEAFAVICTERKLQ